MNPLTALFQAFGAAGVGLDVEAVRDAVWLASLIAADSKPAPRGNHGIAEDVSVTAATPLSEVSPADEIKTAGEEPVAPRSYARPGRAASQDTGAVPPLRSVRLPRAAGLVGDRGIPVALRSLRRKVRSPKAPIDEIATVQRAIEDDLWLPIYRYAADRWLELALVVDNGISMSVWQEVALELRRVFTRAGAFRDVRLWSLSSERDVIGVSRLSTRRTRDEAPARVQSPFGGGRRGMVIVMSDCVSAGWYDGRVLSLLHRWSRESPVALLQVLPERMWSRTALAEGSQVKLRAVAAAMTNPHLHWTADLPVPEAGWRSRGTGVGPNLALFPVVTAEPSSLRRLARMVSGISDESVNGVLFDTAVKGSLPFMRTMNPEERVRRFWSVSSSAAAELASLLSAAPVQSTGVLTLLRRELLPGSDPSVEAEVLFSGLVSVPENANAHEGNVPLELQPDVRPLLLQNAPVDRVFEVLRSVAAHTPIPGISSQTFETWIANPSSAEESLRPGADPIASQVAVILEQVGGAYARIVHSTARRGPAVLQPSGVGSKTTDSQSEPDARLMRIVVSSPGQVTAERASLREIVERLNATSASARQVRLEVVDSEEGVAARERIESADLYLGIMTSRHSTFFEEECQAALDQHKKVGKPRILLYSNENVTALAKDGQSERVIQFIETVKKGNVVRGYYGLGEFRHRLEEDLANAVEVFGTPAPAPGATTRRPTCLVIMGFGVKVDYVTSRSLDLNKSYEVIRRAVEDAGLECVRADDLIHSGVVDRPMYERLLSADLVVADLSTSNANAIYELGIRHGLRPHATIVIAEREFKFPFDLGHLAIFHYEHLGQDIGYVEAGRVRDFLGNEIRSRLDKRVVDSPIYTFLPWLVTPSEGESRQAGLHAPPLSTQPTAASQKPQCFVIMGFGTKVDYVTNRAFDLDKSYRVIRMAVEEAGLECIRADDIVHSGVVDKPMYEHLVSADLVIADLSTSNANALYELGIRHALRPRTTIVIAEKQFKFPFDVGHVVIRHYEHLGSGIDYDEATRLQEELVQLIRTGLGTPVVDSPVYTFLPQLMRETADAARTATTGAAVADVPASESFTARLEAFREASAKGDFRLAKVYVEKLRESRKDDPYLIQQHALVTYKSRDPDPATALSSAKSILAELKPRETRDPETIGLWAGIHKRMWDLSRRLPDLDEAIAAYRRAFDLKEDYYTGINLAFLLTTRASLTTTPDAASDTLNAERVRRRVITICESLLQTHPEGSEPKTESEEVFWIKATLAEALLGVGENERAIAMQTTLIAQAPAKWMADTLNNQMSTLRGLLAGARAHPA